MSHEGDRSLAHPIEELRDLAELVRVMDRLVVVQQEQLARMTSLESTLASQIVNNCLWSGAVAIPASGWFTKSFQIPFASVFIDDPNQIGDLLVVAGGQPADPDPVEHPGVGNARVGRGRSRSIAMVGRDLAIGSLAGTSGVVYLSVFTTTQPSSSAGAATSAYAGASTPATEVPLVAMGFQYPDGTIDALAGVPSFGEIALPVNAGSATLVSLGAVSALGAGAVLDNGAARSNHCLVVESSAGVTAGAVQLEGSLDNVNWYDLGAAVSTDAASTVFPPVFVTGATRYLRAAITTAITGGTVSASVVSSG